MKKKILLSLLALLVIIQFIRPSRNISPAISANDISNHHPVPANVQDILSRACNDCHTNNTTYPWYTNIQPVGWWMQHHVNEGKRELNFSEFASYTPKRQHHKMEEVEEMVDRNNMPLDSYTWIHKNANLKPEEKTALLEWAGKIRNDIATKNNIVPEKKK